MICPLAHRVVLLGLIVAGAGSAVVAAADSPASVRFERTVIDADLADAYQVEVADVDGDGRADVVALGDKVIAWYQNPSWTKRVIGTTDAGPLVADLISSATTDLDGDGRAEVAIACDFAMNTPTRGQLWLASQGATLDAPWTLRKVQEIPSIHRVRWADLHGDRQLKLIVAPIFGPKSQPPTYDQDVARVVELTPARGEPKTGAWTEREVIRRPVVHAVAVAPERFRQAAGHQPAWIMTADNTGLSVAITHRDGAGRNLAWEAIAGSLIPGAAGPAPKRGCSDLAAVRLPGQPLNFATIEPWHGSTVALWQPNVGATPPPTDAAAGPAASGPVGSFTRTVLDSTLDEGHALWVGDIDADGIDEVFAGHRGRDHRVAMYHRAGNEWTRTVLDTAIAAQDLRGGDLDGDGRPDIVAAGGKTHNVVWYHPVRVVPPR